MLSVTRAGVTRLEVKGRVVARDEDAGKLIIQLGHLPRGLDNAKGRVKPDPCRAR